MSTIKTNAILDASGGNTTTINGTTPTAYNTMGKNLIINGAMDIDQRNAGASVTVPAYTNTYVMDRWHGYGQPDASKYSLRQVAADGAALAAGFLKCAQVTSAGAHTQTSSDIYFIRHFIEGLNMSHLRWGTSDAKACVLSFWVKSHKTGTHGGSILDQPSAWSHPFTYSVSSANTWEYKTVSIAAPTSGGTFLTTNDKGCQVVFSLSVGSSFVGTAGAWTNTPNGFGASGAVNVLDAASTWSITGVQLEVGSVATEFERRPYGMELALCQRYYQTISAAMGIGNYYSSAQIQTLIPHLCTMRSAPSIGYTGALNFTDSQSNFTQSSGYVSSTQAATEGSMVVFGNFSGVTGFRPYYFTSPNSSNRLITLSSEL
jgi:hypothetical protein